MDFKKLKGLTIQDVIVEEPTIYDDDPSIVLWMSNGRKYRIEGGYEEGTDESTSEMRSKLTLSSVNVKREPKFRVDELEKKDDDIITKEHVERMFSRLDYDDMYSLYQRLSGKI